MSSPPWERDRALDLAAARSAIRAAFPGVEATDLVLLGSGWEFDAYATGDGWAFRFPRRSEYASRFDEERAVLALVRAALPTEIALPLIELIGAPSPHFQGSPR